MFFMVDTVDIASYADDSPSYSVGNNQCKLEKKLQKVLLKLYNWFHENGLKANRDKSHYMSSLDISTKFSLPACILKNSGSQKLLGVTIDNLCNKASRKFNHSQQFSHIYPKLWLNHSRTFNNSINDLHKRALSLVWKELITFFRTLKKR